MSKQQTAVEWLYNELKYHIKVEWPMNKSIRNKFEQAKAIEKEQIMKARIDGDENHTLVGNKRKEYAQQYYKDTYES